MRLIICYLYLFLFSISYCLGQGSFGKITSQPADFIRYGLTPVSYFSGKVNVEIPIYTLQDPDLSMPLSLSYTSDGLKPAKHPGLVGLDWVVNFGVVITREVYGAPDDANGYNGYDPASNSGYNMERGFWIASQERKFTAKQLLTFAPSVVECDSYSCYLPMTSGGYYYDAQPDLSFFVFRVRPDIL